MQHSQYRSAMARRVFTAVLLCLLFFVAIAVAVAFGAPRLLATFEPVRQLEQLLAQFPPAQLAPILALLLLPALALTLLLGLLLAGWSVRPLQKLVSAATMLTSSSSLFPGQSLGEVGQITRNFSELSDLLLRSSRELEKQNRLMNASVSRLEQLLGVANELSATLDTEPLLLRVAQALRNQLGYERAAVALLEQSELHFYLDEASVGMPPLRIPVSDTSVAGRAIRSGANVRVDDLRNQPLAASPGMPVLRSELAVPVLHGQQVLGVLVVQNSAVNAFSQADEEQLSVLARMLAGSLAASSRFHDEQLRRQLAEAIYRVSQQLSGALALEQVPELILDQLAQVLPADRSALLFVDGDMVQIMATRGYEQGAVVSRLAIPVHMMPLIAEIVARGQAMLVTDTMRDSRYRPMAGSAPARSWLGAPLLRFGQVIGVLVLESDEAQRYSQDEQIAMTAIANQAAVALENARLYSEAQDRAQRLEVITELTKLVSTRDVMRELHGILRSAIHRIRRIVPCDYAALALYNSDDETFTVEPVYDATVRDWAALPASVRIPAADTPWLMATRTAGPVLQSNLLQSAFANDRALASQGLQSSIVVPIMGANQAIGALQFASRSAETYSQIQISTLLELAHYLGPALYNARLNREREAATNQLAQTQEYLNLVDKVRVVGQLASGVAHDFNNLLAGILGNAQLLLYEVQDSEQRDMLRVIERAAKDGSETVRRLQGFARMEHDSPMTEVRMDMLARDAIDITRPRWRDVAQSKGVSIEIVRQLQPVAPIAGRAAELREVMTNLIINAVDAMPEGGKITLSTYDDMQGGGQDAVVFEVADSGIGMPAEVQARIFDPFFTTKGEHGTGLGLAVSLGIIQGHGGQIELDSDVGRGTRFSVRLPVRAPEIAFANEQHHEAPMVPGSLLLIESEPMIRESLVRLLTLWGHRVTQATGGVEALKLFAPEQFDVVISDQNMPDMSGWDLLATIRQRDPRTPTVMLTGWGRQLNDDELAARGVDFIIEKPFDQEALRRVLARAMQPKPGA